MKTQNNNSSPVEYSYFLDKWNSKMMEWEQKEQKSRQEKRSFRHMITNLLVILSIG